MNLLSVLDLSCWISKCSERKKILKRQKLVLNEHFLERCASDFCIVRWSGCLRFVFAHVTSSHGAENRPVPGKKWKRKQCERTNENACGVFYAGLSVFETPRHGWHETQRFNESVGVSRLVLTSTMTSHTGKCAEFVCVNHLHCTSFWTLPSLLAISHQWSQIVGQCSTHNAAQ